MSEHERSETITVPRGTLRGSERVNRQSPPLLRGEMSELVDEETLELPVPVTAAEDCKEINILHVDDDPDIADLTKTFLEQNEDDFSVVYETSAVAALDRLRNSSIDCIVSDYDMPNVDGLELLELVRDQFPDLPFILFTAKGSEEVASEAIAAGVTDYMQKEVGPEQYEVLANRVRNAVDRYRTQQRFWDALSWYQRLVEQNLTGVFVIQHGEFAYVNERFAEIFRYSRTELTGELPMAIVADEDEAKVREIVELDTDEQFRCEFTGKRSDGTPVDVEVHGGRIQYGGDPGCIGVLWDQENPHC
jgi:PAS domain S-box-containing protein